MSVYGFISLWFLTGFIACIIARLITGVKIEVRVYLLFTLLGIFSLIITIVALIIDFHADFLKKIDLILKKQI
jgi:hypothetical protein